MNKLHRNPLALAFAILVILYSIGVPVPYLGRNPCTAWFPVSVYVALPREMCYVAGSGWVELP